MNENLRDLRTYRLNHLLQDSEYQTRTRGLIRDVLNPVFGVIEGNGFVIYPSLEEGLEMDRFVDELVKEGLVSLVNNYGGK